MNIFVLLSSLAMMESEQRAGIILFQNNRYLLVQSTNSSKWSFTKGHAEPHDINVLETATREVREESGYVETEHYKIVSGPYDYGRSTYWYGEVLPSAPQPTLKLDEHKGVGWFTRSEIKHLHINKDIRVWLTHDKIDNESQPSS